MKELWELAILPLLRATGACAIVEIGSERGIVTEWLAEYARENDGVVHSIDPKPRFDVRKFEDRFGRTLEVHPSPSVEALPKIDAADFVLIDGDHNWFTVLAELRLLGDLESFPLVVLHDVGWPYGRRDLYYEPARIPKGARQRHRRGGLSPGRDALTPDGLNAHLNHAVHEGGPRNGVLTAVEDFLRETPHDLEFHRFDGLFGFGLLVPAKRSSEKTDLADEIDRLRSPQFAGKWTGLLECRRIESAAALQRQTRQLEKTRSALEKAQERLGKSRAKRKRQKADLQRELERERERLDTRLASRADELDFVSHHLLTAEWDLAAERDALTAVSDELDAVRADARELARRLQESEKALARSNAMVEAARRDLASTERKIDESTTEVDALRARVREQEESEAELRSGMSRIEGRLRDAIEANASAEASAAAADARAEAARGEAARIEARADEQEADLRRSNSALEEATARLEELNAALGRAQAESSSASTRIAELEKGDERLREEVSQQRGALIDQQAETSRFAERVMSERSDLADSARRLSQSRSWRFGHGLFLMLKRFRPGRTRRESALDLMIERLERPMAPPRAAGPPALVPRRLSAEQSGSPGDGRSDLSHVVGRKLDAGTLERLAAAPAATVVVPVHNAAPQVRRCFESVALNTPKPAEVLIVDDASSDPAVLSLLDTYRDLENVRVVRNDVNLGFTASVNRGLAETTGDVVLLNSDTEVGPRWLDNLRVAAYSAGEIGTVTPLSDNAGAFSAPTLGASNETPPGLETDAVARLVSQNSRRLRPEAPTGSGFCLYMKRAMTEEVGEFDAVTFPRGYGEENDYCMRALAAGWRHVVDDATYVRHEREASFGAEKAELLDAGREAVDRKHPTYTERVRQFVRSAQMEEARAVVRYAFAHRTEARVKPRLLFVIHEGSGGTPATNRDLIHALSADYDCFVLSSDSKIVRLRRHGDITYDVDAWELDRPWNITEFGRGDFRRIALQVLSEHAIELVHIRHLFKHAMDLPRVASALGIPVVYSFHDFYLACPSVHLLDNNDHYCEGRCTPGAGTCRQPSTLLRDAPNLKHEWVNVWRREVGALLGEASALVTTSAHAKGVYRRLFPDLEARFELIEHGRDCERRSAVAGPPDSGPIKVLIPGSLEFHKGAEQLAGIKQLDRDDQIELHFLGSDPSDETAHLGTFHGRYEREEFADRAAEIAPAVVGLFSVWPETYCHVLTEAWAAGIPVVANDIGALGERMRRHGGGWLVPPGDARAAYQRIRSLREDRDGFEAAVREVGEIEIRDTATMARDYDALYRRVFHDRRTVTTESTRPATATLSPRLIRLAACVPGEPGAEPGSSHVRVLSRLSHPRIASRVQSHFPAPDRLARNGSAPDAVLVQRTAVAPELVPTLLEWADDTDTPLVVELDDDLLALEEHPKYGLHINSVEVLVKAASLVTVSTEALARSLAGLTARVAVVPNALDERLWFANAVEPDGEVEERGALRVLYMGTRTHSRDLELLKPVIAAVRDEAGVDMRLEVIGGEEPGPGQDWYERIAVPDGFAVYPRFVPWLRAKSHRWDVAVAPLVDDGFNRSKSDLKFLEYSALGLPSIVSDVEAYSEVEDGVEGLRVANDIESWSRALVRLADDEDLRRGYAEAALETVRSSRCLEEDAGRYLSLLSQVAGARRA